MAIIRGNRTQINLFPSSIDEFVSSDDPVRVYDSFIEALNSEELGLDTQENKVGAPRYDNLTMLKILVYSYSYGWRSSRKIERALLHNVSFMWLSGGLKPDHKTISNFRKTNKGSLKKVLKQCAKFCIETDLIEGNILFIDGSKFRANAGISQSRTAKGHMEREAFLDKRISELLAEIEKKDQEETSLKSMNDLKEKVKKIQGQKGKIKDILNIIQEQDKRFNTTDIDSKVMKGRQGSHSSYNIQISTDDKHGLIVHADATNSANDFNELTNQVRKADENLSQPSKIICADAGYASANDIANIIDEKQIIVPTPNLVRASEKQINPFDKQNFIYNKQKDIYLCPKGKELYRSSYNESKKCYRYRLKNNPCNTCEFFGKCTKDKRGREITRLLNQEVVDKMELDYKQESNKNIYRRRQTKVELPFGHLKRNLGAGYFLLRGKTGANAEISILSTCFNISRIINLFGGVKETLKAISKYKLKITN